MGAADLVGHFRNERPDVLHTCLYRAHQLGRLVGKLAGVPLVVSSQQSIDAWQKPWHGWLDRLSLRSCDLVLTNSAAASSLIEARRTSANRPRIERLDNGLDQDRLSPVERGVARRALQIPEDAVVWGSLTRLHYEKGADQLPLFAEHLLGRFPDVHVAVAGVGPLEASLRRGSAKSAYGSRLHWLGWQEDIARFISAVDVFFLLSREESFPQALLEAASMGKPWLAAEVGGVRELLNAGSIGFLYKGGPSEAATAAEALMRQLGQATTAAQDISGTLRQRYDAKTMAERFYALLK
jgi:glycosyltransferase involved in cell wall biosynthesis